MLQEVVSVKFGKLKNQLYLSQYLPGLLSEAVGRVISYQRAVCACALEWDVNIWI